MAIIIGFSQKLPASYAEIVLDKLDACYEAVKYFHNNLFTSHTVELWFDGPSKALGGSSQGEIPAQNPYNALLTLRDRLETLTFQDLRRVIVIFRGVWHIKDIELAGYFSLHIPDDLRNIYGDLEIAAYPQGDIEDIVDAFWQMKNVTEIVTDFVRAFNRGISTLKIALYQIAFYQGIYNRYDPDGIRAIYISSERRGLLRLFYEARRKEKDWDMETFAKALDTKFLLDTLEETDLVQDRINKELEQDAALEIPVGSKLYMGKEADSFKKLYRDVTDSIIKPALSKLPKDTSVKTQIVEGLKDYTE